LFDRLVFELEGVFRSLHLLFSISVLTSYLPTDLGEYHSYGAKAAQHYGAIRATLEKLGQPIGVNDLHIAVHARSEGLVLVMNNMSEFVRVPALELENWALTNDRLP
jgi:hypothetical protein